MFHDRKTSRTVGGLGILLALLSVSLTTASAQVKETPRPVRDGSATLVQHFSPTQMLRLTVGLQPPHMDEERKFLADVQTKGSPVFHHFLSAEEWTKRFDPSEQDEQAVVDWAKSQGLNVTHRFANRLIVDVEGPSATIEKAFGVTINEYQAGTRSFFSADRDPEIPSHLTSVIQSVGGLNNYLVLKPASKTMKEPDFAVYAPGEVVAKAGAGSHDGDHAKYLTALKASEQKAAQRKAALKNGSVPPPITGGAYDPTDIYSSEAYNTNGLNHLGHCCNPLGNAGGTPPQTSVAIATAGAHLGTDVSGFQAQYPYLAYHWWEYYIDGTPSCCDGEGTMDLEWITAMANSFGSYTDTASVIWYSGVNANFSTFNDIWNQMLSDGLARTMSTSWGCREVGCYDTGDMNTADSIFSSMVGQGWTLVAASGDQGATAGCGDAVAIQFPSSDPNVVAAGGTTLSLDSNSNYVSEVAWTGGPAGCGSNDGGSTGGYSTFYGVPSYQSSLVGVPSRGVPDIALNADWYNTPQNIYFQGVLSGNGGTSIVAPETSGFFANEEAYLLYLSSVISGGLCNGHGCGPLGNGNYYLYYFGENPTYPSHYPFYDITSGCNNNDVTAFYGLGYYCTLTGWDPVTGWGSFNMLQLAWAINTYEAGDFGAPSVNFTGPTTSVWYNTDQIVSWTVTDTSGCCSLPPTGVAGFTQTWDTYIPDSNSLSTPGFGDGYYSGPQFANATAGCVEFAGGGSCAGGVGQGWHYAVVRAYDNSGWNAEYVYGPIGYDTIAPTTTAALAGTPRGSVYVSPVTVTLTASDPTPGSGIFATYYQVDGGALLTYGGAFVVSTVGNHTVAFYSRDVAGNYETTKSVSFWIKSPVTVVVTSSVNPSAFHQSVTFKATVTASFGPTPLGNVAFKNNGVVMGTVALSGGVATFATSALALGNHTIIAVYGGSGKDIALGSSPITQTVNKASTSSVVTSSVNPSSWHQSVTFSATVTGAFGGTATGTVSFKNGTTIMGTGTLAGGVATFTTAALTVGVHSMTVVYSGDTNFTGSTSSPLAQTVNKAATTTTLAASINPVTHGNPVTFTATIHPAFGGVATGNVNFKDGTTVIGSGVVSSTNKATFTTSSLAVGTHTITATYVGDVHFKTSTSAAVKEVVQ